MTTNLNFAQCIKQSNNFGSTMIQNICDGSTAIVPWGSLDWLGFFGLCAFALLVLAMIGRLVHMMIFDSF